MDEGDGGERIDREVIGLNGRFLVWFGDRFRFLGEVLIISCWFFFFRCFLWGRCLGVGYGRGCLFLFLQGFVVFRIRVFSFGVCFEIFEFKSGVQFCRGQFLGQYLLDLVNYFRDAGVDVEVVGSVVVQVLVDQFCQELAVIGFFVYQRFIGVILKRGEERQDYIRVRVFFFRQGF